MVTDAQSPAPAPSAGLHELLGLAAPDGTAPGGAWTPAMAVLASTAAGHLHRCPPEAGMAWIGRAVRPEPDALPETIAGTPLHLPRRSVVVTPHGHTSRFWAIERAMRTASIRCVVADGSRADHVITRRLQVLAMHTSTLVLLARPVTEHTTPSSAQARWVVRRQPTDGPQPCWHVHLLRARFAATRREGEHWADAHAHTAANAMPLHEGVFTWAPGHVLHGIDSVEDAHA